MLPFLALRLVLLALIVATAQADYLEVHNNVDERQQLLRNQAQNHRSDLSSLRSILPNIFGNQDDAIQKQTSVEGCDASKLCPLQLVMLFMGVSLAGPEFAEGPNFCNSGLEWFGGEDADCEFVFTGKGRSDAIICTNATVYPTVDDGLNYCDVGIPAAIKFTDQILLYQHFFFPASGIEKRFTSANGESLRFTGLSGLVKIAFGEDNQDGVVDYVFKSMKEKGCFTRPNPGVNIIGFSFGGILSQMLAIQIAAEYPDVFVRVFSAGEPAAVIEPLSGAAAAYAFWSLVKAYPRHPISSPKPLMTRLGIHMSSKVTMLKLAVLPPRTT